MSLLNKKTTLFFDNKNNKKLDLILVNEKSLKIPARSKKRKGCKPSSKNVVFQSFFVSSRK